MQKSLENVIRMKRAVEILFYTTLLLLPLMVRANSDISYLASMPHDTLYHRGQMYQATYPDSAIIYYSILYNRYSESMSVAHKQSCAEAMLNTGILYYRKNNYSEAMNIWLKGLRISQSNNFKHILSQIYTYIGNIYSVHNDYEQSVAFYKKSLEVTQQCSDIEQQNHVLNNLIFSLCYCEKVDEAHIYYEKLRQNASDTCSRYQYDLLMSKAVLLSVEMQPHAAIEYYRKAVQVALSDSLGTQCVGAAYNGMAKIYAHENKLDSALKIFHLNEELARRTGTIDLLAVSLGNLAGMYERTNDVENYNFYKKLHVELNDSIFNQRKFNSLKNAQFLYELNCSDEIITQLTEQKYEHEQKIYRQRLLIVSILLGMLLGGILLVYIWIQKRHLTTAYNELYNRNQEAIRREENYKNHMLLMREMYESGSNESDIHSPEVEDDEIKNANIGIAISNELRVQILHGIIKVMEKEEEICNNEFNITRLATLIGSNTRYVSQVINDEYGMNFRSLLNECRVKVAMKRISDIENYGLYTIKAISESVGYKSQANFIRVFTQYTGIKPSMYQKISRERK